ncbi:hypothetical protein C1645_819548 [Glomus cerebriforme]|uniref:Uncharacterized protein n=1 Tax=Glomus cerebriforme TaxID=658196 RepID=A0A397TAB8_9GLOM|nr:hypothetical protein C1645_819548 [Glomus cerebriforme]
MEKLELIKGQPINFSAYIKEEVLKRELVCGGTTLKNENEIFIERPITENNLEKTLNEKEDVEKMERDLLELRNFSNETLKQKKNLESKISALEKEKTAKEKEFEETLKECEYHLKQITPSKDEKRLLTLINFYVDKTTRRTDKIEMLESLTRTFFGKDYRCYFDEENNCYAPLKMEYSSCEEYFRDIFIDFLETGVFEKLYDTIEEMIDINYNCKDSFVRDLKLYVGDKKIWDKSIGAGFDNYEFEEYDEKSDDLISLPKNSDSFLSVSIKRYVKKDLLERYRESKFFSNLELVKQELQEQTQKIAQLEKDLLLATKKLVKKNRKMRKCRIISGELSEKLGKIINQGSKPIFIEFELSSEDEDRWTSFFEVKDGDISFFPFNDFYDEIVSTNYCKQKAQETRSART